MLMLYHYILDAFAKLRKATISFFVSVLPPVSQHEQLGGRRLQLDWLSWNSIFGYFSKVRWESLSFI